MKTRLLILMLATALLLPGLVTAQDGPFTIQADEALRPAVDALYAAIFDGETPAYVDEDAAVLVTSDAGALAGAVGEETLPDYFMPEAGIAALTDDEAAAEFVAFAVSPEGQQALIDADFLPAVITITDQAGNEIDIPQPVRRVITPHSIATYTVYGVGGADRLVAAAFLGARDEPGLSRMEQLDPRFPEISSSTMSQREINVEEVALLAPDVILTSSRSQWLDAVAELEIPVVLFQGETPELLKEAVLLVGQILGPNTTAQAEAWVDYYDSVFATVTGATADLEERPAVLFSGSEPLRVASGEMYQSYMVAAAGGASVTAELAGYWNDTNLEQVAVWNPAVIFSTPYGGATVEAFTDSAEWQVINAVQEGQVYQMPFYIAPWDTPIPESVLGIIWMTDTLYPDLLDLDCKTETAFFYRAFYAYELPEDEITALCGP